MNRFIRALQYLFNRSRREAELSQELQFHLEMQVEEYRSQGLDEPEARRRAMLELGGLEQTRERCREAYAGRFLDILMQDLRYGIRSLLREPVFLLVVVAMIGLGIGATTAVFSVAHAVLLKPLPYSQPEKLVMVWNREKDGSFSNTSYATFEDWKAGVHSLQYLAAMSYWSPTLSGSGDPVVLEGSSVSADFFRVLGVSPVLGRGFLETEDRPNANHVVILSHKLWQSRFGSDPSIVGKQILLGGLPRTIVGVMPAAFQSLPSFNGRDAEIYRPLGYDASLPWACRDCNHLRVVARIADGATFRQAQTELGGFTEGLITRYRQFYGIAGASLVPLQEEFVADTRTVLLVLLGAVGLVLLIACGNIANLVLARATRRSAEMAVRSALGAGRARLLRQMLTETFLLSAIGGAVGVFLAWCATNLLLFYAPKIPRLQAVSIDLPVLLFAMCVTILTAVLTGLVPALQASRIAEGDALHQTARSLGSRESSGLRKGLIVSNIAMSLLLLTGAGLLLQSVKSLMRQELGFKPEHVLTLTVSTNGPAYREQPRVYSFFDRVLEGVAAIPGVESAGLVSQLPMSSNLDMYGVEIKDKPLPHLSDSPSAERFAVTGGLIPALGIHILRGRAITDQDRADTQPVVLVNRTFAEKIWPGEDALGKQIHIGESEYPWRTVVGVFQDVRHRSLQAPFDMQFLMPFKQWEDNSMTLVVRSNIDPRSLEQSIRSAIHSVDPNQPISDVATMNQTVAASLGQRTFVLKLIEVFGFAAVLLAAIGVYGLMVYTASQRVQEIGLRMALGADNRGIILLLMRGAFRLNLLGVLIGIAVSLRLTPLLRSLLFQIQPWDPRILTFVALLLLSIATAAGFIPALRASRLNPARLLRQN